MYGVVGVMFSVFRTHTWNIAEYTQRKAQEGTGRHSMYAECVCYLLFPLTFQLILQSRPNEKSIPFVWGK